MRKRSSLFGMLILSMVLLSEASILWAQVPLGQILGTVSDPAGAAVPGATVEVMNESTGIQQTMVTNASGEYIFAYLNPGSYKVTVRREGFATSVFSNLTLQVGNKMRVDAKLVVGQTVQKIEVKGATPKLDTDSAAVGGVVSSREVTAMPLNGREFSQLAVLMPGVRVNGPFASTGGASTGSALGVVFATAIDVGGTTYNKNGYNEDGLDNTFNVWNGPAMNPSIDAIQEVRVDRSQFTAEYGRGGAEVDLVTKSGTNQLHGTMWEYLRNGALDAGNYITHLQDTLKQNQFGADLGGPIKKDKAFFFGNWESQRQVTSVETLGSVFTTKMRQGDLSEFTTPVKDPQTGLPFGNNLIPNGRLDGVSLSYMNAMMHLPNQPGIVNNYLNSSGTRDFWDQYILRVDYNLSPKNSIFVRGNEEHRSGLTPPAAANDNQETTNFKFWNFGVGLTRTWSPRFVTETRFGFHRESLILGNLLPATLPTVKFTLFGTVQPAADRLPSISISPSYSYVQVGTPIAFTQDSYELLQNASLIIRNHRIKFGYDGRSQILDKTAAPQYYLTASFGGQYTGNGVGDYLLGIPFTASETLGFVPRSSPYGDYGVFIQDDWRATRSLTLNLGLRYQIATQPSEVHDLWGNFDPQTQKMVLAGSQLNTAAANPVLAAAYSSDFAFASQVGFPIHTLAFGDHNDFAPRVGFAWSPFSDNRTVVRGGYGIFYELFDGNIGFTAANTQPYAGGVSQTNTTPTPSFYYDAPFGAGVATPPLPSQSFVDPNNRSPYLQQATFGIERQLPWGVVGSINFEDQNSKKLESSWNLNQPAPGGTGAVQARRPYPQYVSLSGIFHDGHGRYDDAEFELKKQSTHYTFDWSHTWANNLERIAVIDPFHRDEFYGRGDVVPQYDKFNFVMDLPFGKGMRWGSSAGKAVDLPLGGWTVSGIFKLYQSGDILTPTVSGDPANVGISTDRPTRLCSGKLSNPTMAQWFNPACFGPAIAGTVGNSGTGILLGPPQKGYDLGIYKTFAIEERVRVQFRTEMFDAFNHPILADPQLSASVPSTLGTITTKNLSPRVIQFALRVMF